MKPITIDPVDDVGDLCNLLIPKNVLALTAVTITAPSNNGSGPHTVTLPKPALYIDAQQKTVLIQAGQYFGHAIKLLKYTLILYDPVGSRVYQEQWYRNPDGVFQSMRSFASPDVVAKLTYKTRQIHAWRSWLQHPLINGKLPQWYAMGRLPEWLAFGELPVELADNVNDDEHRRWFRRAQMRAKHGIVK